MPETEIIIQNILRFRSQRRRNRTRILFITLGIGGGLLNFFALACLLGKRE